jgi:nicotinate-nucleotide pyrophosphorylase (carboxylating)
MQAWSPDCRQRPPDGLIRKAVESALAEDLGLAGDVTTTATVPTDMSACTAIAARASGLLSGLAVAQAVFAAVDASIAFTSLSQDGMRVEAGTRVAEITGTARSLLAAERTALNFLSRMSGIATLTRAYVDAVEGTGASIIDTRKTTPGLRAFEKYAVACGGGYNHRFGLFDAVLIKDNHVAAAGGVTKAVQAAKAHIGHMVKIEVEVDTLEQFDEALDAGADIVMLDNMDPATMREAVRRAGGRVVLEASGGVSLQTVRAIAESGVDLISVGALTHSAPILDFGLDFL